MDTLFIEDRPETPYERAKARAFQKARSLGHDLGLFPVSRKKIRGKATRDAICSRCGLRVFVIPKEMYHAEGPVLEGRCGG